MGIKIFISIRIKFIFLKNVKGFGCPNTLFYLCRQKQKHTTCMIKLILITSIAIYLIIGALVVRKIISLCQKEGWTYETYIYTFIQDNESRERLLSNPTYGNIVIITAFFFLALAWPYTIIKLK